MNPTPAPPGEPSELAALEARVNALLPPEYQFRSGPVSPTSMGSAGLKYGPDSRVAWDEIWTSFCDLALAGGPPHRGSLLEPPAAEEVEADPAGYQLVTEEIVRGVRMTAGLDAVPASPGWVAVRCDDEGMASWLLRAVTAENVFARRGGDALHLPAGPRFRLAREIKNVVVAVAKTCHYWNGHLSPDQRRAAGLAMAGDALLEPACRAEAAARPGDYRASAEAMAREVERATGLKAVAAPSAAWVGARFANEATAAWFVRAAVAEGVLARREEEVLYLPVPPPGQARFEAAERLARLHRLWQSYRPPTGGGPGG